MIVATNKEPLTTAMIIEASYEAEAREHHWFLEACLDALVGDRYAKIIVADEINRERRECDGADFTRVVVP